MQRAQYPPYLKPDDCLILFDGVCRLCNAWSRFVIRFDRKRRLKLASVQSDAGQAILAYFDYPTDEFETMLYIEEGRSYEKTDAFFRILSRMGYPWKLLTILRVVPRALRDWCYDRIALNRYRIFGKYDRCLLPTPDHAARFLNGEG